MKIAKDIAKRNEEYEEDKEKFLKLYVCMLRKFLLQSDKVIRSLFEARKYESLILAQDKRWRRT